MLLGFRDAKGCKAEADECKRERAFDAAIYISRSNDLAACLCCVCVCCSGVNLLVRRVGHHTDDALVHQVLDGRPGQAAVYLQTGTALPSDVQFAVARQYVGHWRETPEASARWEQGRVMEYRSAGLQALRRTLRRSDKTEGVIILYFGTSASSLS